MMICTTLGRVFWYKTIYVMAINLIHANRKNWQNYKSRQNSIVSEISSKSSSKDGEKGEGSAQPDHQRLAPTKGVNIV